MPCEEFEKPKHPISWAPFFGSFTAPAPRPGGVSSDKGEDATARRLGEEATGGYDPDAYAPGAGQKPTPLPPPPPSSGVGGGGTAGKTGSE